MLSQHDNTYIVMFVEDIGATCATNQQCIRVVLACHGGPMCMCESKFKCAIYILIYSQVGLAVGDTKVIRDQIEFQRLSLKVCKSIHVLLCLCLYIMQYINFHNIYIRV